MVPNMLVIFKETIILEKKCTYIMCRNTCLVMFTRVNQPATVRNGNVRIVGSETPSLHTIYTFSDYFE